MTTKSKHENLIELQDNLRHDIEEKEAVFNYWISRIMMYGLLIIPLVPASLTFMSIATNFPGLLHIDQWMAYGVGLITAFAVEFLGLMTLRTALRMSKYNQQAKALGLAPSPAWQGWITAGCYVLIILSIVVFLKIFPALVLWSLIPMSLMAAIAEWGFLLNADQSEREMEARKKLLADSGLQSVETLQDEIERKDAAITELQGAVTSLLKVVETLQASTETRFNELQQGFNEKVETLQANTLDVTMLQGQVTEVSTMLQEKIESVSTMLHGQVTEVSTMLQGLKVQPVTLQPEVTLAETSGYNLQEQVTTTAIDDCNLKDETETAVTTYKNKAERQSALIRYIATNLNGETSDKLNKSQIGKAFGTSHVTISKDIEDLIGQQRLSVNGHIRVLA